MKNIITLSIVCLLTTSSYAASETDYIQDSRKAVKELASSLKSALMSSMKEGGAIAAINTCNIQAPEITAKISANNNFTIRRTSLKNRNLANQPDTWEEQVLKQFEKRKAGGEEIAAIEHSEIVTTGDKKVFRYMKAIPTGKPCLNCHGNDINSKVSEKLKALYPNDKATGFKPGDIRGAFSIIRDLP